MQKNVSYALQQPSGEKDNNFKGLILIKNTRKVHTIKDYFHMHTHDQINNELLCVPIIKFSILVRFNIQRNVCASVSIRV